MSKATPDASALRAYTETAGNLGRRWREAAERLAGLLPGIELYAADEA